MSIPPSHAPSPAPVATAPSPWRQPSAVWAIAFACAVSFMGIGLVDPILPAISEELHADAAQTMLLFTSYLLVTALAMFFTGWVSSRLGVRRTLLLGLALVVIFAALAGASSGIGSVIGFRAGWGLGNALFISTALSAIVGVASGGSAQAVVLYEAALGAGMAVGPLVGGVLGEVSWRAPFFGTATLMAIAFLAIAVLLRRPVDLGGPRIGAGAGLAALRRRPLLVLGIVALFYNFAFFTLLAYSPFPIEAAAEARGLEVGAHELGLVFFGWGIALAFASVFAAPVLTRRLGLRPVLFGMLVLLAAAMAAMAAAPGSLPLLVTLVIVCGVFLGVLNTALTETVMEATTLPRGVASSTYSGIRFLGGAAAPAVAGGIAAAWGAGAPYWSAVIALGISVGVLVLGGRYLPAAHARPHANAREEAEAITAGDEA